MPSWRSGAVVNHVATPAISIVGLQPIVWTSCRTDDKLPHSNPDCSLGAVTHAPSILNRKWIALNQHLATRACTTMCNCLPSANAIKLVRTTVGIDVLDAS